MADVDDFGSLDDSVLLQACEEYEQSQSDDTAGGTAPDATAKSSSSEQSQSDDTAGGTTTDATAKSSSSESAEGVGTSSEEGSLSKPAALKTLADYEGKATTVDEAIYEMNNDLITDFVRQVRGKYINTSDLQMQEWCEQQMIYNIGSKYGMAPVMITEEGASVPMKDIELTTPAMKAGTKIHKEKDLEVNSYVPINVTGQADSWAVKMMNTIQSIRQLVTGARCIREIVALSMPFDYGILFMGIVDELRMNEFDELELVEVKTRSSPRPPSKAQKRTHDLQAMMYKQIIDDLVSGVVIGKDLLAKLRLDPKQVLGDEVSAHAQQIGITGNTLNDVMTCMLDQFRFLPKVSSIVLEYYPNTSGDRKKMFRSDRVEFNETWLRRRLESHLGFWCGEREVKGIEDLGELWKCGMCQFADACHWRKRKNDECLKKNTFK